MLSPSVASLWRFGFWRNTNTTRKPMALLFYDTPLDLFMKDQGVAASAGGGPSGTEFLV
jgi:hypothetical protein